MIEESLETKEQTKTRNTKWKEYGVFGVGLIAAFVIGFMARPEPKSFSKDYTTKKPVAEQTEEAATKPVKISSKEADAAPKNEADSKPKVAGNTTGCPVKGNVSGKNKIYHVSGGSFYARVKEEVCFQTEDEAASAGFRKSQR